MAAALLLASCRSTPPQEPKDYVGKIAAERAAKDAAFAAGDDPIPKAKHAEFLPLAYFPIDPDYNVPGVLNVISYKVYNKVGGGYSANAIEMAYSDEATRQIQLVNNTIYSATDAMFEIKNPRVDIRIFPKRRNQLR